MAASYHQKQFLPFAAGGAPNIHSLSNSHTQSHVLVTTDRSVGVVQYDAVRCEYALQELTLERFASPDAEVITSGVIEYPGREAIAVAYADDDKMYLHVAAATELLREAAAPASKSNGSAGTSVKKNAVASAIATASPSSSSSIRFELVAAPTAITSVTALAASGAPELFYGIILFRDDSMVAFGYVEDTHACDAAAVQPQCTRLSSEQFSRFFPELAAFTHTVLAVDTQLLTVSDTSWLALGCANGLVRVFSGREQRGCSCGPFETRDFQIDGPVTSVSLFATMRTDDSQQLQCNVLATCAIGHALVIEDAFGAMPTTELLTGSDAFDSIFAGVALDIDLDGRVELLLGTDDQLLLAYKRTEAGAREMLSEPTVATNNNEDDERDEQQRRAVFQGSALPSSDHSPSFAPTPDTTDVPTEHTAEQSPAASSSMHSESHETLTAPHTRPTSDDTITTASVDTSTHSAATQQFWSSLPTSQWRVQVFGAVYSLARLDVNRDGVDELLVASSTGVYVFEADAAVVLRRLEALLVSAAAQ